MLFVGQKSSKDKQTSVDLTGLWNKSSQIFGNTSEGSQVIIQRLNAYVFYILYIFTGEKQGECNEMETSGFCMKPNHNIMKI